MPDSLQKIFRTLGDPTRLRILALLEREELAVQELMEVLGMAQSRVSRHLGILREAKLLRDRRDGTFVLYRFEPPADASWLCSSCSECTSPPPRNSSECSSARAPEMVVE